MKVNRLGALLAEQWHTYVVRIAIIVTFAVTAQAAPPRLNNLQPRGGQTGQTFALTLAGDFLRPDAEIITTIPGAIERVQRPTDAKDLRKLLPLMITVRSDASVGAYPIRIRTADGLSNVLMFSVSDLPEVPEGGPNETIDQTQLVNMPAVINGTLSAADQDHYRVHAKVGDRLVFEAEAARIGSGVDPTLVLFTEAGREIAVNDDAAGLDIDARIDLVVPADGTYVIRIHDTTYGSPSPNFYRLKIGSFPYCEGIFPLGWTRGGAVNVSFVGGNLAGDEREPASLILPIHGTWTPVALEAGSRRATLPFRFVVSDEPEMIEPDKPGSCTLVPGTVINGRLAKPGEIDRYKMTVAPGQRWLFSLDAASLGTSQLDGLLTIHGKDNKQLASADDGRGLDPRLSFAVPGGVTEIVVAVEDLHRRGGPAFAYRLSAKPRSNDFTLRVETPFVNIAPQDHVPVKVSVERVGYNGPIQLSLPADITDINAEGGVIPAGRNEGFLMLSAAANAKPRALELPILGYAGPATKRFSRTATGSYAETFPAAVGVPAAICADKPIRVTPANRTLRLVHGYGNKVKLTVQRGKGADGDIKIDSIRVPTGGNSPLSGGVTGGSNTIKKGTNEVEIELKSQTDSPAGRRNWLLQASTTVNGEPVIVILPKMTIDLVRPFTVEILSPFASVAPGSETKLVGLLRRVAPFDKAVTVQATDLPAAVTSEPVTVAPDQSVFEIVLKTTDQAEPGEVNVNLKASAKMPGRKRTKEYELPDVMTKFKVIKDKGT